VSDRPVLRVVSGDATPEEIAAVVTAVAASSASEAQGATGPGATSVWAVPAHAHRRIRAAFTPSPDGWRTSFWPR
jgi:hypothetical protein